MLLISFICSWHLKRASAFVSIDRCFITACVEFLAYTDLKFKDKLVFRPSNSFQHRESKPLHVKSLKLFERVK